MALGYIDRLGLYNSIFLDPSQKRSVFPETVAWSKAYSILPAVVQGQASPALKGLASTLLAAENDIFLAWLLCALAPWTTLMTPRQYTPKKGQPKTSAALVAREGLKVDNKNKDVVDKAASRLPRVISLKNSVIKASDELGSAKRKRECVSREELGMQLRDWGASWRSSVVLAMLVELMLADQTEGRSYSMGSLGRLTLVGSGKVLKEYHDFVLHIQYANLSDAHLVKPVVDGKRLMEEVGRKPGPWLTGALRALLRWQFRNPDLEDPAEGIEEVTSRYKNSG